MRLQKDSLLGGERTEARIDVPREHGMPVLLAA